MALAFRPFGVFDYEKMILLAYAVRDVHELLERTIFFRRSSVFMGFKSPAVNAVGIVEAICNGFGISLSQFFSDGDTIEVSSEYKPLIDCWSALSPEQREAALKLLQVINQA